MKPLGNTISIIKDTNRAVCTSETDWSSVRPGSYIRFTDDEIFYIVARTNKIFYIKEFESDGGSVGRKITIQGDVGINLNKGDSLSISYKEWTLFTLMDIKSGGKNYKVDDKIYPRAGTLSVDTSSGHKQPTCFRVTEVDENGTIKNLALEESGLYLQTPVSDCDGGSGSGVQLDLEYRVLDDRKLADRIIHSVKATHLGAEILLNYPLPDGVKSGKLSVQKWEILLTTNYLGDTRLDEPYSISRDFSPNFKLPLLVNNSFAVAMLYNQSMQVIDAELTALKKELLELRRLLVK